MSGLSDGKHRLSVTLVGINYVLVIGRRMSRLMFARLESFLFLRNNY